MSATTAVFFMNDYNQIDHISPIAYKWLRETDHTATIVFTASIPDDYRIDLLSAFDGASLTTIAEIAGEDATVDSFGRQEFAASGEGILSSVIDGAKAVGRSLPTELPRNLYDAVTPDHYQWLVGTGESVLAATTAGADRAVVAFDWAHANPKGDPRRRFNHEIVQAAAERGYSTFALPHGDRSYTNAIYTDDQFDRAVAATGIEQYDDLFVFTYDDPEVERAERGAFDYYVVPNWNCEARLRHVLDDDTLTTLGSPRFNREWIDVIDDAVPAYVPSGPPESINIVFFPRGVDYLLREREIVRTIRFLSAFSTVNVTVKAHTRLRSRLLEALPDESALGERVNVVFNEVHSPSVLQWADAVVDLGTSITFEAVQRDLPVFHLDYAHCNRALLPQYLPDSRMECPDDLHESVCSLLDDGEFRNYTERERDEFVQDIIVGKCGGEDRVLESYVDLFEGSLS